LNVARHALTAGSVGPGIARKKVLVGSAIVAAVVVAVVVVAFALGSEGSSQTPPTVTGGARVTALLSGIPQHGTTLGSTKAPVTLIEFADPQCPYCGVWARDTLPTIVTRYVRPGKVLLVFEGMSFVGPDSLTALRTALAASRQNRFWNVLELLFENQGPESTGWITEPLLRSIGEAVPGLDTDRMLGDRNSAAVDAEIRQADSVARKAGVAATPTFAVGETSGSMRIVHMTSLTPSGLIPILDSAAKP
jgi:protein-disulfide isomerase